jgi:hypothetical protein
MMEPVKIVNTDIEMFKVSVWPVSLKVIGIALLDVHPKVLIPEMEIN